MSPLQSEEGVSLESYASKPKEGHLIVNVISYVNPKSPEGRHGTSLRSKRQWLPNFNRWHGFPFQQDNDEIHFWNENNQRPTNNGQEGNWPNGGNPESNPGQGGNWPNSGNPENNPGQGSNWSNGGNPENNPSSGGRPTRPQTTQRPTTTATRRPGQGGNAGCNCATTPEYNPVCGSNSQTYSNPQKLKCAQRCGQGKNYHWL